MKCPLPTCRRGAFFQQAIEKNPDEVERLYQCHNGHVFRTLETYLLGETEAKETPGQPSSAEPSSQEPSSAPS